MTSSAAFLEEALEFHRRGQFARAEAGYASVLRLDPKCADALHLRGVLAHQRGNASEARNWIGRAIEAGGACPEYLINLGAVERADGRAERALDCYLEAAAERPDLPGLQFNIGNAYGDLGDWRNAAAHYRIAMEISPESATAQHQLGKALHALDDFDEAEAAYRRALQLDPQLADAELDLGLLLKHRGDYDGAIGVLRRIIATSDDAVPAWCNLGTVYEQAGDFDVADDCYEMALQLRPGCGTARFNRALLHLLRGWNDWTGYASRWEQKRDPYAGVAPVWDGAPLGGRSLLIHPEQGLGDEIMFAGCLEQLRQCDEAITIACDPRLVPLFRRSFGEFDIIGADAVPVGVFDVRMPIGELPLRTEFDLCNQNARRGYLIADLDAAGRWKSPSSDRLRVGISWRGGKREHVRRLKSTALADWSTVLNTPGIAWFNLQYDLTDSEREFLNENNVRWEGLPDPLIDVDGFAAFVDSLDLVITASNATAHLAGALGRPSWILLPHVPDWRWGLDEERTPWYASAELIRQDETREWRTVLERVASRLRRAVSDPLTRTASPR